MFGRAESASLEINKSVGPGEGLGVIAVGRGGYAGIGGGEGGLGGEEKLGG